MVNKLDILQLFRRGDFNPLGDKFSFRKLLSTQGLRLGGYYHVEISKKIGKRSKCEINKEK